MASRGVSEREVEDEGKGGRMRRGSLGPASSEEADPGGHHIPRRRDAVSAKEYPPNSAGIQEHVRISGYKRKIAGRVGGPNMTSRSVDPIQVPKVAP